MFTPPTRIGKPDTCYTSPKIVRSRHRRNDIEMVGTLQSYSIEVKNGKTQ